MLKHPCADLNGPVKTGFAFLYRMLINQTLSYLTEIALRMCKTGTSVSRMTPDQESSVHRTQRIEMLPLEPFRKQGVLQ